MVNVFARIGVIVPMTENEYEDFCGIQSDTKTASKFFWERFDRERRLLGDSYIPCGESYGLPHKELNLAEKTDGDHDNNDDEMSKVVELMFHLMGATDYVTNALLGMEIIKDCSTIDGINVNTIYDSIMRFNEWLVGATAKIYKEEDEIDG